MPRFISATLQRAAEAIDAEGDAKAVRRTRPASTHWMRHVQLLLGHDDIATTGEYIGGDDQAPRAGAHRLFGQA